MLVKSPAVKLAVEIRAVDFSGGRVVLTGVAGAMPCTVEIAPAEARAILGMMLHPSRVLRALRFLMRA